MLERLPPRRDPRVLLVDATTTLLAYAALDAWEVRGLGELPRRGTSQALQRLALQVRPSHVVLIPPGARNARTSLRRGLLDVTRRGIATVSLTKGGRTRLRALAPGLPDLRRTYPELRHLVTPDTPRAVLAAVQLALAVLLHHPLPPRHYAPRQPARSASRLARPQP